MLRSFFARRSLYKPAQSSSFHYARGSALYTPFRTITFLSSMAPMLSLTSLHSSQPSDVLRSRRNFKFIKRLKRSFSASRHEVSHESTRQDEPLPDRLRRCEAVIRHRAANLVLVIETLHNDYNLQATLRTAEALGVLHVWNIKALDKVKKTILPGLEETLEGVETKKQNTSISKGIAKGASVWLKIRNFDTVSDCVSALKEENYQIWASSLSPKARRLEFEDLSHRLDQQQDDYDDSDLANQVHPKNSERDSETEQVIPDRLALVIGRETDGVSQAFLDSADQHVFMPMHGFCESFNVSVAAGLMLQRIFDLRPSMRGNLTKDQRDQLRQEYWARLAHNKRSRRSSAHPYDKYLTHPEVNAPDFDMELRRKDSARLPRVSRKLRMKMDKVEGHRPFKGMDDLK